MHGFREENLYHFSLSWLFNFLNSSKLVISFLCEPYFELIFHINGKKKFEIFFQILLNIYHCIANISQKKFSSERSFKKKSNLLRLKKDKISGQVLGDCLNCNRTKVQLKSTFRKIQKGNFEEMNC